ncbi:SNF2-related protein [Chloroflexota bacterium]
MCPTVTSDVKFKRLDKVRLRSKPKVMGVIQGILESEPDGFMYHVFFSADDQRYVHESDLILANQAEIDGKVVTCFTRLDELRREILLCKLRSPHSANLYSLHASRVEFHVYQFKPVLKFLHNPEQRLLLADEVGLGKTIEAGIIMTELQARVDLSRVLVVCPAGLRSKWRAEMRSRFEEDFEEMDANAVRLFLDDYEEYGESKTLKGIVSIELLRRSGFIDRLAEGQVHFDLVIVDEAHHCRNPETNANQLVTVLGENADALLLLTATPLHLGNQDLFHLLQILSPGEFDDLDLFRERIAPNRYVNNASRLLTTNQPRKAYRELKKVERTSDRRRYTQNPYYHETLKLLNARTLDRDQIMQAQRMLLDLNSLAHIFTRSRKREVIHGAPVRDAKLISFEFHPAEQAFCDAVVHFVRQHWRWAMDQPWSVGFALVMRERQAASCIPAFRDNYVERMTRLYVDAEDLDMADGLLPDEGRAQELRFPLPLQEAAKKLATTAKLVTGMDTKYDRFLHVLRQVLKTDPGRQDSSLFFLPKDTRISL